MYGYCVFPSLSVPQFCLMNPKGEKNSSRILLLQVYAGFSCRKVQIFKFVMIHYFEFFSVYSGFLVQVTFFGYNLLSKQCLAMGICLHQTGGDC